MQKHDISEQEYLKHYDANRYAKPSVSVDVLIFAIRDNDLEKGLDVLLIKRKNHPFRGCWAIPGGFVDINEDLKAAAYRELREETSICEGNVQLKQLHAYGAVHRDPRMRVISIAYLAVVDASNITVKSNDDASDAMWFHISYDQEQLELTSVDDRVQICYKKGQDIAIHDEIHHRLAFDHQRIIADGIKEIMEDVR